MVGAHIALALNQAGSSIVALKRPESRTTFTADLHTLMGLSSIYGRIQWQDCDLDNGEALLDIIQPNDIIIHAAGWVSFDSKDYPILLETNGYLTRTLVNVALEKKATKFVYISSIAAVDMALGVKGKKTDWKFFQRTQPYGYTKYLGELEVLRGAEEGLATCIINPGVVLGAAPHNHPFHRFIERVRRGLPLMPTGTTGYIGASELAQCVRNATQSSEPRIIAVTQNLRHAEVVSTVCHLLGLEPPKNQLKGWRLYLVRWMVKLGWIPSLSSASLRSLTRVSTYPELQAMEGLHWKTCLSHAVAFFSKSSSKVY